VVCPRGISADQTNYESHNLWLIDERLPYYTFFNSDRTIAQQTSTGEGGRKPDITFFDVAISFQQSREPVPLIIVEFKRPGRDDYTTSDNPIDQCIDYVERIRSGDAAVDSTGHRVSWIKDDSLFYCYIIADITASLRRVVTKHDLMRTPDGRGYWKYHDGLRTLRAIRFVHGIDISRDGKVR
jgi:hypothetical protein